VIDHAVTIRPDGMPTKIVGDKLTLHDLGRGTTQDPSTGDKLPGMDSSHLIANMFGGSGYTKAKNIVLASAEYNQKVMRKKEDEIFKYIEKIPNAATFSMEVMVCYADPADALFVAEVRDALALLTKTDDERHMLSDPDLLARIEANVKKAGQQRVRNVEYLVVIYDGTGIEINKKDFELDEEDILFGSK
jgi:hypothetical protein